MLTTGKTTLSFTSLIWDRISPAIYMHEKSLASEPSSTNLLNVIAAPAIRQNHSNGKCAFLNISSDCCDSLTRSQTLRITQEGKLDLRQFAEEICISRNISQEFASALTMDITALLISEENPKSFRE
jgi:hypothetical protein